VRGLVRRDAEEDLLDELLHQRRRRATRTATRRLHRVTRAVWFGKRSRARLIRGWMQTQK
jgi:hypothetical protein